MNPLHTDVTATERARAALDNIEMDFFQIQSGVRAGEPPEWANNENGVGNPHNEPDVIALYGVIIAE